jgi:hypothetical protein
MSTAVANAKETAVSTDVMDDIFEFAGEGTSFDSSEMQIPFIRLLQPLSPQLNKKKAGVHRRRALLGTMPSTTSQASTGTAKQGIKCHRSATRPPSIWSSCHANSGGGFQRRDHPLPATCCSRPAASGAPSEILPNGNELVKSDQHFCLVVEEDGSVSSPR